MFRLSFERAQVKECNLRLNRNFDPWKGKEEDCVASV